MPMCGWRHIKHRQREMTQCRKIGNSSSFCCRSPCGRRTRPIDGRRQFLHSAGRLALGAGAAMGLGKLFGNPYALAAEAVTLPEITSIPERLKGKGVVRVSSYGGAFQEAQRKAYFEPFERLSGIKVIESRRPGRGQGQGYGRHEERRVGRCRVRPCRRHQSQEARATIGRRSTTAWSTPATSTKRSATNTPSTCCPTRRSAHTERTCSRARSPDGWADFWDTKKFPGGRTMPAGIGRPGARPRVGDHGGRRADGQGLSDRHRQGLRQPHEDQACRGQVVGGGRHPGTAAERQGNHDGHRMERPHRGHPGEGRTRRDRLAPGCVAHRLLGRAEGSHRTAKTR